LNGFIVKRDIAMQRVPEMLRFAVRLFQRVITVSLETMKIVRSLPGLEI
jgi:hypothetical protein